MSDGKIIIDTDLDNSGIEKGVSKLSSIASTGLKTVTTIIAGTVTAVGGLGLAATKVGMNFESSMSQVAATMGITVDEISNGSEAFDMLEQAAKDAGATTQFSASQSAEALNYLALAGYDAEKSVAALPTVLNLAAAGGLDLGYASDLVTDSMSALGLQTEELEGFVDQLAKTSQKSNTSVGQLGEAILTVGGTAKVLSGGVTEMNTVLGILADNGIKGAEGGTALRNMILSLTAPTDTAAKAISDLGLKVLDANGNMRPMNDIFNDLNGTLSTMTQGEQTQVLNKIFNKVDLKSVNALLANSGERFDELSGYISDCDGAAANMAETMNDNLRGKMTILGSSLEGLGIQIYERLEGPLKTAAETAIESLGNIADSLANGDLGGSIDKLADAFGNMITKIAEGVEEWLPKVIEFLTWILDNGDKISGIVLAIGSAWTTWKVLSTLSSVLPVIIGFVSALFLELATAPTILAGISGVISLLGGPVTIIIGLVAALVAGIVYLWNTNEGFRDAVINCWNAILDAGKACWQWLVKFFTIDIPNAWNSMILWFGNVGSWFSELWNNIKKVFIDGWNSVVSFFTESIPAWWEGVKQSFVNGWQAITDFFTETIPELIQNVIEWFNQLPYMIGYVLGYVLATIVQWGVNTWNSFIETCTNIYNSVTEWFSQLPGKIEEFITTAYNNIVIWGTNTWNKFIEICTNVLTTVVEWFSQLPGKLWDCFTLAYTRVVTWGSDMYSKAVEIGTNFINNIINWFSQLPGKISTWLTNTISKVSEFASNLGRKALEAGKAMVDNIINAVRNLPSQMASIGKNIVEGVWNGITGMGSWLAGKVSGFFSGIVDGAKKALGIHSPSRVFRDEVGKYMAQGVGVGFEDETKNVQKSMEGDFEYLVAKMSATVDYETAMTTARVVVNNNVLSGAVETDDSISKENPVTVVAKFIIDGKEFTQTVVAPNQDVLSKYYEGR